MLTLILAFILLCAYFQWKRRRLVEVAKVLKHDLPSVPILGIAHMFLGDGKVIMQSIDKLGEEAYKQGGITSIWLIHNLFVVIADPAVASLVSKECLEKHYIMKACMRYMLGETHLIASVPVWRHKRKIALPFFTTSGIKSYMPVFVEQSNILVDKLRSTVGEPVLVFNKFLRQSLEVLIQVGLGVCLDLQNAGESMLVSGFEEVAEMIGSRFFKPWLHYDCIYELLPEFKTVAKVRKEAFNLLDESILLKRDSLEKSGTRSGKKFNSFVEQYIATDQKHRLNDVEIRDELMGFILAGTDTSSISASFAVSMLARHPEVQDRLFEEIKTHLPVDYNGDDILSLKYLDAFIKEILRMYPPTPIIVRTVENDVTLPTGIVLPEGCGIMLHLKAINRNPEYWGPDAEEFRPERFLQTSLKHPAQYIPFSFGPRNCIGYRFAISSLKVTLAILVRHLSVHPVTDLNGKSTEFKLSYGITMKDDDNFPVIFRSRV